MSDFATWMTAHPFFGFVLLMTTLLGAVAIIRAIAKIFHRAPVVLRLSDEDFQRIRMEVLAALPDADDDEEESAEDDEDRAPAPPVRRRNDRVRIRVEPATPKSRWDHLQADDV